MSEAPYVALALVAGAALGLFYFGGLWLTLQRVGQSRHPAAFALASFFGRTVVVVAGIYLVASASWRRIAACLLGFVVVRGLMIRRVRPAKRAARCRGDAVPSGEREHE